MKSRILLTLVVGVVFTQRIGFAQELFPGHLPDRVESAQDVGVVAESAVLNWERQNEIKVFAEARQKVEGDFREQSSNLIATLRKRKAAPQLLETIVENYLFNVRDGAIKAVPAHTVRGGISFLP